MSNYDTDHDKVLAVQKAINAAGYSPALVEDGAYGPKTEAGVKWFQGQHNLTQDGIIGDLTMAATIVTAPATATLAAQAVPALLPVTLSQLIPAAAAAAPAIHIGGAALPPAVIKAAAPVAAAAVTAAVTAPKIAMPAPAAKSKIPIWAIPAALVVAGGGIGFAIGRLLGMAIGAGVGLVGGVVEAELTKPKGATMHGEDLTPDNDMIIE